MKEKTTIFLLSDSTVQSYEEYYYPQTGWGQVFYENFAGGDRVVEKPLETCSYPQGRLYDLGDIAIENRAIGGRSSRSFIEEGKFDEAIKEVKEGDYVFVQFGHNDATIQRPERYVAVKDFHIYIKKYIEACKEKGAECILVTPVARRNCDDGDVFNISFEEYRQVMLSMGKESGVQVLDLGKVSTEYLNLIGNERSKELYLHTKAGQYKGAYSEGVEDNTHLSIDGARIYSKMVAGLIKDNTVLSKSLGKYLLED